MSTAAGTERKRPQHKLGWCNVERARSGFKYVIYIYFILFFSLALFRMDVLKCSVNGGKKCEKLTIFVRSRIETVCFLSLIEVLFTYMYKDKTHKYTFYAHIHIYTYIHVSSMNKRIILNRCGFASSGE